MSDKADKTIMVQREKKRDRLDSILVQFTKLYRHFLFDI